MVTRFQSRLKSTIRWISDHHWVLVTLLIALFLGMEVYEHGAFQLNVFFLTEIMFYISSMLTIGYLTHLLLRTNSRQRQVARILNIKSRIREDALRSEGREEIASSLIQVAAEIAPVLESSLLIIDQITHRPVPIIRWKDDEADLPSAPFLESCRLCHSQPAEQVTGLHLCQSELPDQAAGAPSCECYCLPIRGEQDLIGLIRLRLKPGKHLNTEQKEVFDAIKDDMALALQATAGRQALAELRMTEASLTERRKFTHYLHDSLGQNLAFLRLKLGQMVGNDGQVLIDSQKKDLVRMLDVADDSYEIVRGTLEIVVPQSTPNLTNLLKQFAQKAADRSHFSLSFLEKGKECATSEAARKEIFLSSGK